MKATHKYKYKTNTNNIMKNFFLIITTCVLSFFISSCSQKAKLENEAKKQMEATFKEIAKDPSSVKLSNDEIVYSDDSLCIIHVDFAAKNGLGTEVKQRTEYIFIHSNGKNYEAYQEIPNDNEGVYVSEEKYEKAKKGKIYQSLDYNSGMRYLAAIYVNGDGREAGNSESEAFSIPVPTGTGSWDLKSYQDEFGEEGAGKYLVLMGNGVFSNSATTDSKLTALLFIDNDFDFSFKLVEYNSSIVKSDDSYDFRIKDSQGDVHSMTLYNSDESGQMHSWSSEDKETLKSILKKGGVITVSVRERDAYSTPDTYLFRLNVSGFDKASSYLK